MDSTRRTFLTTLGAIAGAGAMAKLVAACGDDSGGGTDTGGPVDCSSVNATIMANHMHMLVVSAADVTAAADKTYDITGGAMHTHMVTVTAANFATLASSGAVTVTTTSAAMHMHTISIVCG